MLRNGIKPIIVPCTRHWVNDDRIGDVLKMCSQRVYLLKLLRDRGLPRRQLNNVFDALVLSTLRYADPVWSGFMSAELKGR